ncbi:MAG: cbb3-type cytochrome oxidase assembly protein CcoS [Candidatus Omnitrophica bacterium]|nr:cbb3-type cytochrome oxidase assembly protein CcoS [Candidatus Omnitrophota bacterium]
MIILWLIFIGSLVLLPGTALLALRWAVRRGEFHNLQKAALSIFDEEEPVGLVTDHFPGMEIPDANRRAPRDP